MLIVISPAKNLDYESPLSTDKFTQPSFIPQAEELIRDLRQLSAEDISALMKISPKLGELNFQRYHDWQPRFSPSNARPAVMAFNGDVYTGLEAPSLDSESLDYAQDHLRILSGLYGLLRPLDLMQAYRLEMGTRFASEASGAKNLYGFWGNVITEALNQQLQAVDSEYLVNLASTEYFKSVKPKLLNATVVTPQFKDLKNGEYKMISFFAKKARGMMARYIVENRVEDYETLKGFDSAGYRYSEEQSKENELVFLRDNAA